MSQQLNARKLLLAYVHACLTDFDSETEKKIWIESLIIQVFGERHEWMIEMIEADFRNRSKSTRKYTVGQE